MIRIDEQLPESALHSEVVLHVRRHLRTAIRTKASTAPADLAHLFGFARAEGSRPEWGEAARDPGPIQAGARVAAARRGGCSVVTLGHDLAHVLECKHWLAERKQQGDAFTRIKASDLATLLELSKARELAAGRSVDEQGRERFLPVLILGPTGTGKELLAEAIHSLWKGSANRPNACFHVVQVAGMPPDVINDELFGHVRGAFTGAAAERIGRLEAADGGTLLIDEVGDLPREAQLRLLRFLQTQTVSRIGENTERPVSVRILAATWHDLDADVAAGRFREDLLHRLRVGSGLVLQPLSRREGFFDEVLPELLRARRHTATPMFTRSARDALAAHAWSGNLRELVGVLDAVLSCAAGETVRVEHLPAHIQRRYLALPLHERALGFLLDEVDGQPLSPGHVAWRIAELERCLEQVPLPPPNEQLAAVGQFLSLLDDSSEEHQQSVTEVQRLIDLDRKRRGTMEAAAFWRKLLGAGLPTSIAKQVEDMARAAGEKQRTIEGEISAIQQRGHVESNPWLSLLREIHALPLLKGANVGELGGTFLAVFSIVKLFAPHAIEQVRDDMRLGGFSRVRDRFLKSLREPEEEQPALAPPPLEIPPIAPSAHPRRPGQLSRKEWQALARRYPTQRAAIEATGYDPKTIAKYLRKHRIPSPWRLENK
jgi:DNA-binding NtrC family response regulator